MADGNEVLPAAPSPEVTPLPLAPANAREALDNLQQELFRHSELLEQQEAGTENPEQMAEAIQQSFDQLLNARIQLNALLFQPEIAVEKPDLVRQIQGALAVLDEMIEGNTLLQLHAELEDLEKEIPEAAEPEPAGPESPSDSTEEPAAETPTEKPAEPKPEAEPATYELADYLIKNPKAHQAKKGKFGQFFEGLAEKGFGRHLARAVNFFRNFSLGGMIPGMPNTALTSTVLDSLYHSLGIMPADLRHAARDQLAANTVPLQIVEGNNDAAIARSLEQEWQKSSQTVRPPLLATYVQDKLQGFIEKNRELLNQQPAENPPQITLAALLGPTAKVLELPENA